MLSDMDQPLGVSWRSRFHRMISAFACPLARLGGLLFHLSLLYNHSSLFLTPLLSADKKVFYYSLIFLLSLYFSVSFYAFLRFVWSFLLFIRLGTFMTGWDLE